MPAPAEAFRPHVGVHLILAEGRKVLLLRRANTGFADGWWSVPGGSLEHGETLPQAAARKALEEVGVTIDPADLSFARPAPSRPYNGFQGGPNGAARAADSAAWPSLLLTLPLRLAFNSRSAGAKIADHSVGAASWEVTEPRRI